MIESNIIHEEKTSQSLTVYKFYTEDEREIAQRIKNSNITLDFRSEEIYKIVHKHFQPGQKETYCGSPFAVKLDIDGYYYCSKTNEDIVVTMDFSNEELGSVNKVPKITLGSAYSSVGAISVSSVIANLQAGENNAAAG